MTLLGASDMVLSKYADMFSTVGREFGDFEVEGLDLEYNSFDTSVFSNIKITSSLLRCTGFTRANISGAVFLDCDFSEASLDKAVLTNVFFLNCDLTKTSFRDSTLKNVSFTSSYGAIDLTNSDLTGCIFFQSLLCGSNMHGALIKDTTLEQCDLSSCFLSRRTSFEDVRISGCDITGLYVSHVNGAETTVLAECVYKPYMGDIEGAKHNILPLELNDDPDYVSINGHQAKLYCSSMEEYKAVL